MNGILATRQPAQDNAGSALNAYRASDPQLADVASKRSDTQRKGDGLHPSRACSNRRSSVPERGWQTRRRRRAACAWISSTRTKLPACSRIRIPGSTSIPPSRCQRTTALRDLARVLVLIPDDDHVTTRYYGLYANRPRGKRREAEAPPAIVPAPRLAPTEAARCWAALLQQIREVDPLAYPTCHGTMRIVALLMRASMIDQILTHLPASRGRPTPAREVPPRPAPLRRAASVSRHGGRGEGDAERVRWGVQSIYDLL